MLVSPQKRNEHTKRMKALACSNEIWRKHESEHRLNVAPSPEQMEAIRTLKRGSLLKNFSIVQRKS